MRKVRIGNDINVRWEVKTDGQAVSLEGKTLKLYVRSAYKKEEITTFTVEGCVVSFTYPASMQRMTGARAVILVDATEGAPRRTVCADQAFILVAHSCEESDDDVEFEDFMVSLQSNVLIGKPGLSAYEVWLSEGNTGTLADWYAYLQKPATDVAAEVTKAETARATAEQERKNAENARNEAETARQEAENGRDTAEQERAGNEDTRKTAEQSRNTAELNRRTDENIRTENESARITEENKRIAAERRRAATFSALSADVDAVVGKANTAIEETDDAEALRADAEAGRTRAEDERETNEQKRKLGETERKSAEMQREEVEESRVAAENSRVTAEKQRYDAEQERRQHEDAREDSEGKRNTAETLRKQAETGRNNAEQERTASEQTRMENETQRETNERKREEAEDKREEAIVKFENDFNEKLDLKADLEQFNNTVSGINTNIATKANAQDVTNAIGELQDKIGDRVVVSGNVTNNPDEEDITTEGDTPQTQVLKLKDRAYDSLNASGKGYKILRKNWQPINGGRKNVLTQDMINEPNTIYEIRYDFDLNGEEITLPEYCGLRFNGGSFNNGKCNFKSLGHIVVKAKEFGFRKGTDSTTSNHNGVLFQSLISSGVGIDFENEEYNLHFSTWVYFEYLHIQNGILNISSNRNFYSIFHPAPNNRNGYINIINVTLKSTAKDECVLIYDEGIVNNYYKCFSIKNCTFDKVSFLRFSLKDSNPADINSRCGANSIIIENNNILNTTREFMMLGSAFYTKAIIRNNHIKNAKRCVFYFGVDNDYTLFSNKENGILLFEYNSHINDDDFLCVSNYSSYVCTLLTENKVVIMRNNVFQNIRAFNSVVYAFYVSSNYFECSNNIIKNVFNFNENSHKTKEIPDVTQWYNNIFKSKQSGSAGTKENPGIRLIKDNTVLIERINYIAAMKLAPEIPDDYAHYDEVMLCTSIIDCVDYQNLTFINNNIKIEGIFKPHTSTNNYLDVIVKNNYIEFYNISIGLNFENNIDVQTNPAPFILTRFDSSQREYVIEDNVFTCSSSKITPIMSMCSLKLINGIGSDSSCVIIRNNIGNNIYFTLSSFNKNLDATGEIYNRKIIFDNNKSIPLFKSDANLFREVSIPASDEVIIKNSTLASKLFFFTKKIDLDLVFNLKQGYDKNAPYLSLPILDEGECYIIKYVKDSGEYKSMELYKQGTEFYLTSDTNVDNFRYGNLREKIVIKLNNKSSDGTLDFKIENNSIKIYINLGFTSKFSRLIVKHFSHRLYLYLQKGTTTNRPTLSSENIGFKYYDTDLKKYIVWNGTEWTNMDGTSLGE